MKKLKINRISYNWRQDATYTCIWAIIIVTLFVLILQALIHPGESLTMPLLAINGFFVPIITFFVGLRPVLGLFAIPDTLYINAQGQLITSTAEVITMEDIDRLEICQVGAGAGHLIYYEMTLKKIPSILKGRKRKSLVMTERYNIKHLFQTRTDLIDKLVCLGLDEKKVSARPYSIKGFWGIRDKFKK